MLKFELKKEMRLDFAVQSLLRGKEIDLGPDVIISVGIQMPFLEEYQQAAQNVIKKTAAQDCEADKEFFDELRNIVGEMMTKLWLEAKSLGD